MPQFQGSLGPLQYLQAKGHPRPPTLQKNGSAATSERKTGKSRATDFVIWLDVLLLVLGASTFAVILKLAGMEL